MRGYDFSHWNADKQVSERLKTADFIFHKMSEGTGTDPKILSRMGMIPKTMPMGVYHLIKPKHLSVGTERMKIEEMFDKLRDIRSDIGLALDLEATDYYVPYNSPDSILEWVVSLVDGLHKKYNIPIILYMGDLYPEHWYQRLSQAGGVFWIARWGSRPRHECHFWQDTSKYDGENLDGDLSMKPDNEILTVLQFNGKIEDKEEEEEVKYPCTVSEAVEVLAREVIAGRFGNGSARKENLYRIIQQKVNELV